MNILFISKLSGNLWAGPNNSVPAQVLAQSKIDNVMWVNLNHICLPEWRRKEYQFINFDDIDNCTLNSLPKPFNNPDFIVCEEVYCYFPFDKMLSSIIKSGLPYSIVPRSTLTLSAQKKKKLKKKIANFIFYDKFIKHASFILFLTHSEKNESPKCINQKSVIIPNGTYLVQKSHKDYEKRSIKVVYIGRMEIYQKGLDVLIEAVGRVANKLRQSKITIELYGPDRENAVEKLTTTIDRYNIQDIVMLKPPVFGKEKDMILDNSDVFIMASRFEGMPMGLIEALSHGLPCIASEGTFMMDEIVSYDAGWSAGSTIDDVCKALENISTSTPGIFSRKSHNARRLASQYSWDNLAKTLHDSIKDKI